MALLLSCNPSTQQKKTYDTSSTPLTIPVPIQADCSSLDLTQKVGFSTSYITDENKFCYKIVSNGAYFFDSLSLCDAQGRPIPGYLEFIRDFAGPKKGEMQINSILQVSDTRKEFIPFWREASGKISTILFRDVPKDMESNFQHGAKMLDQARTLPEVCQELLKYKPNH